MRRHRRELHMMSELNLTNLLDMAFVLLIAFMLVSPAIKNAIDIKLPAVSTTKVLENQSQQKPLTIVIQKAAAPDLPDMVYVKDQRIDMPTLREIVMSERAANEKLVVVVDADQDSKHGTFTEVTATLRQCGITQLAIGTDPKSTKPKATPTPAP